MSEQRRPILSVTLDDCDVQTFRAGGNGGQNQNKRETGVRIIHRASGARGEARDERSQLQNKRLAFRRMADHPLLRAWIARQSHEYKRIEERAAAWAADQVEHHPELLRLERFDGKRWVPMTTAPEA